MTALDSATKARPFDFLDQQSCRPLIYVVTHYNLLVVNYKTLNGVTNYEFINQFMQEHQHQGLVIFDVPKDSNTLELKGWPNLKGVFYEDADQSLFQKGFEAINKGELWFPRAVTDCWMRKMLENEQQTMLKSNNLTHKELKVLNLLFSGLECSAMADSLFISEATVRVHLHKIYQKINVKNKQQAKIWCKNNLSKFSF